MKKTDLTDAIAEAERFLERAKTLAKASAGYEKAHPETVRYQHVDLDLATLTAAARRSSMDLTRALAALRRYG